jgi:disulfide bond formation protein DsbB
MTPSTSAHVSSAYRWGAMALFFASAAILSALAFEHIGGYRPCQLCLQQRWAYYAGVPLLFLGLVLFSAHKPGGAAFIFAVVAIAFLGNAALGIYHAGAEWKFWPGPDTCGGAVALASEVGNLLDRMKNSTVIRCDEAAIRIAGLSFAGWNVIASLMLSTASAKATLATRDHEHYL